MIIIDRSLYFFIIKHDILLLLIMGWKVTPFRGYLSLL